LATGRRSKDAQTGEWKDLTDWHNIVVWKTENIANYLLKGKQIYLEGRIETRSYEKDGQKHYMTEVICDAANVMLLGGGGAGRGETSSEASDFDRPVSMPRSAQPRPQPVAAPPEDFHQGITDDDVPF
jgi:single-strand DNA-binding protein